MSKQLPEMPIGEIELAFFYRPGGVEVYGINTVLEYLHGAEWFKQPFVVKEPKLMAFMEQYGCAFYAADRENFSISAAITQAQREGKTRVIVEDLS